jgi:hypothetical protein
MEFTEAPAVTTREQAVQQAREWRLEHWNEFTNLEGVGLWLESDGMSYDDVGAMSAYAAYRLKVELEALAKERCRGCREGWSSSSAMEYHIEGGRFHECEATEIRKRLEELSHAG